MSKTSRRGFLGLFSGASAPKPEPKSFSLDAFYAKRGAPPKTLEVKLRSGLPAVETTNIGVPDLIPEETPSDD